MRSSRILASCSSPRIIRRSSCACSRTWPGRRTLIEAFSAAKYHDRTALKVFGRKAGSTNTSCVGGRRSSTTRCSTADSLHARKDIGVTPVVAQEFIDAYFGGFPRVREFIDATVDHARTKGFVETMFGRRRMVPELNSRNGQIRQGAERMTVNFPIQGSAADILKKAMLRVYDVLHTDRAESRGQRARMILTVHDELLIESPEDIGTDVAEAVRDAMQGATNIAVPLTVDVGIGPNWREAKS